MDLRMDTQKFMCVNEIKSCAQNLLIVLGSIFNIIGGTCMIFEQQQKEPSLNDNDQVIYITIKMAMVSIWISQLSHIEVSMSNLITYLN